MAQWDNKARMKNVNDQSPGANDLYTICTNKIKTPGTGTRLTDGIALANEQHGSAKFNKKNGYRLDLGPP